MESQTRRFGVQTGASGHDGLDGAHGGAAPVGVLKTSDNVSLLRGVYEAFRRGDIPAVLGAMHPDIMWNEAENVTYDDGAPFVGPDQVLHKLFIRLGSEWDGFRVDVEEILDCGQRVVALARYRAVYKATGRQLDAQVAHVWTLEEGKVTRFDQYTDTLQFAEVAGQRDRKLRAHTAAV